MKTILQPTKEELKKAERQVCAMRHREDERRDGGG